MVRDGGHVGLRGPIQLTACVPSPEHASGMMRDVLVRRHVSRAGRGGAGWLIRTAPRRPPATLARRARLRPRRRHLPAAGQGQRPVRGPNRHHPGPSQQRPGQPQPADPPRALLTCVYREATAACRADGADGDGPAWPRCRLTCQNIARTDCDIAELRRHVNSLRTDLSTPGTPAPLRRRIRERLDEHERAITEHETTRPQTDPEQPGSTG